MKILGIGNAIVDVICKVEDKFITQNNLTKSTMKLVDEAEFKKLLSTLKIEETISGGSVANSIVGLSQLGNKVGFIGKVSDDDLGNINAIIPFIKEVLQVEFPDVDFIVYDTSEGGMNKIVLKQTN